MRGSVGSFGSPLPKSITGTPSASSRRRSSSRRTKGYVAILVRVVEILTPRRRYRSHNSGREPPSARPRAGRAAGAGIRSRGAGAWDRREGRARRAPRARRDRGRRADRRARPAPAAARSAHLRRQGKAAGARRGVWQRGRRGARRRRRARPDAAARAREHAPGARRRPDAPTIALAGYTNVGKSTLLNALTGAEASVHDRLFETLDPTTRGFDHDGRRYLVTDTVGFIRRLPHQLVEGF